MSVEPDVLALYDPTAQNRAVPGTCVTPERIAFFPGEGLATILQVLPLKCSISVSNPYFGEVLKPTANILVAETGTIAVKVLLIFIPGLATWVQRMPLKCSISVEPVIGFVCSAPTAHALVAEMTVTAFN